MQKMVELYTTGPARVLRLDRGSLSAGKVADITIIDERFEWTYDVNQSFSKSKNSPFDGVRFHGGPMATIVSGKFAWRRDRS